MISQNRRLTMKDNQAKYPQLRFKGFTDPWEERKLGDIAPLRGGFAFKSSKFRNTGVPIVRISNILSSGEVGGDFAYYDEQDKDDKYILPDKSAVLAMSGATTGKVSILSQTDYDKVYQNQRVGYFQSVDYIDYGFISTIVRSELFMMQLESVLVSGAQPNVSSKEIDSFNFMIPILVQEQQKIGSFFKQLDETIALHQRKLAKLKELKQGYLQKLFPKNGSKFPQLRFAGFADAWEQRKLGNELTLLKDGTHGTHQNVLEGPFLLSAKNIKNGKIIIDEITDRKISVEEYNSIHKKFSLEKGDVLLTIVGSIGETAIIEDPIGITFQRSVAYLRPSHTILSQFLFTTINGQKFQMELRKRQVVSAQPGIYLGDLSIIPILIPSVSEQEKIGSFFKQLDETIALHQRKLEKLQELKKGYLQKMFC